MTQVGAFVYNVLFNNIIYRSKETSNKISVKPLPYCFEYPIQTNTFTIEISVKLRKKSHKKHKMDFIFNASLKCCLLALRKKKNQQTMIFFFVTFYE